MAMSISALCAVLLQAAAVLSTGAGVGVGQLMATDNTFTWHGVDGSYRFGLRGADQWRLETRDRHGAVLGQYRYRTPDGGMVQMKFSSGPNNQHLAANQRDLLALKDRVGGGGELLLDADPTRQHTSGPPPYSSRPSSDTRWHEQTFDIAVSSEQPVEALVDGGLAKQQHLSQQEGVMPYGALLLASSAVPLTPGTEHTHLNAIVTNVQPLL